MNEQLQPLMDAMAGKSGWMLAISAWMAASRIVAKPLGAFIQDALSKLISTNPDLAESIVRKSGFRLFAFFVDLIFSIKLPTHKTLIEQIQLAELEFQTAQLKKKSDEGGHVIIEWIITILVIFLMCFALYFFTGCASFTTTQTDERINEKTGEKTKVTTKAKATTFFDSKSSLGNFKANQTEKTQGASVGTISQESNASNAVQTLRLIIEGAKTIP